MEARQTSACPVGRVPLDLAAPTGPEHLRDPVDSLRACPAGQYAVPVAPHASEGIPDGRRIGPSSWPRDQHPDSYRDLPR